VRERERVGERGTSVLEALEDECEVLWHGSCHHEEGDVELNTTAGGTYTTNG